MREKLSTPAEWKSPRVLHRAPPASSLRYLWSVAPLREEGSDFLLLRANGCCFSSDHQTTHTK